MPRPSRRKHCKCMASYTNMGKLQRAITLILRHESKSPCIKSLVSTPSACPCKNYPPKCSQIPHELDYLFKFAFFQASVHTKQKKCPENHVIHLGCTIESYKASKQPRMHSRTMHTKQAPILRNFLNNAHHGYSPFFT